MHALCTGSGGGEGGRSVAYEQVGGGPVLLDLAEGAGTFAARAAAVASLCVECVQLGRDILDLLAEVVAVLRPGGKGEGS